MKTNSLKSIVFVATAISSICAANAQIATRTTVEFFPKKDRYARGEIITVRYTVKYVLTNGASFPLPGARMNVGDWIGSGGWPVGFWANTNSAGQYSFNYRVPTNPFWDNISIVGTTATPGFSLSSVSQRIPIGR